MTSVNTDNLIESLRASFISNRIPSDNTLMPSLLVNDYRKEKKILSALTEELETCEAFDFSVAFINDSGIASIMQKLDYLAFHNIKGRILTTNYLNFTSPGALSKLLQKTTFKVYTPALFYNLSLEKYKFDFQTSLYL